MLMHSASVIGGQYKIIKKMISMNKHTQRQSEVLRYLDMCIDGYFTVILLEKRGCPENGRFVHD